MFLVCYPTSSCRFPISGCLFASRMDHFYLESLICKSGSGSIRTSDWSPVGTQINLKHKFFSAMIRLMFKTWQKSSQNVNSLVSKIDRAHRSLIFVLTRLHQRRVTIKVLFYISHRLYNKKEMQARDLISTDEEWEALVLLVCGWGQQGRGTLKWLENTGKSILESTETCKRLFRMSLNEL